MQNNMALPPDMAALFGPAFIIMIICSLLMSLAMAILFIVIWWRILKKVGWPSPLAFLMMIPLANTIVPICLAFSKWPVHQELEELRAFKANFKDGTESV